MPWRFLEIEAFGEATVQEGGRKMAVRNRRAHAQPTPGRVCGTSFAPHDFCDQPEQLVVLMDGVREHTIDIAANLILISLDAAVAHLHTQPWIQRTRQDEDVHAATASAAALAQKRVEDDPVEDDEPNIELKWGCIQHNRLPRPLQTTPAIRRHRRFDMAISTIVHVLNHRFIQHSDWGSDATARIAMRVEQYASSGRDRRRP